MDEMSGSFFVHARPRTQALLWTYCWRDTALGNWRSAGKKVNSKKNAFVIRRAA